METLHAAQGSFDLTRYPLRQRDVLRAWDAADEYLLNYLNEQNEHGDDVRTLILNDAWGALSTALAGRAPQMLSDSLLAHRATRENLARNGLSSDSIRLLTPQELPTHPIDLLLFKVPKSKALLEDQLHRLRPLLHPGTTIIGAGMVRDIHTSTLELCQRLIGPTHTSLAQKKARLIFAALDAHLDPGPSPYPTRYVLEGTDWTLENAANAFSRQRLDNGTRLLLGHIPSDPSRRHIADLGCGNGVLGLVAAARNPQSEVIFVDESFTAVESARGNFTRIFGSRPARFVAGDGLSESAPDSLDLVLCNPPFHRQKAIDETVPWRLFSQAHAALRRGGQLLIVGNSGLRHHVRIRRLFGTCQTVDSNGPFTVLSATKR